MQFGLKASESKDCSPPQCSILSSLSGEVPVIARPWTQANCCAVCCQKLGVLKRHHCRFCGDTVCKEHAQHYRSHPASGDSVRCCDLCFKQLVSKDTKDEINHHIASLKAAIADTNTSILSNLQDSEAQAKAFLSKTAALTYLKSSLKDHMQPLLLRLNQQREDTQHTQAIHANLLSSLPHALELLRKKQVEYANVSADYSEAMREVETLATDVKSLKRDVIYWTSELEARVPLKELNWYIGGCCRPNLEHISVIGPANISKYRESLYDRKVQQSREIGKEKCKCEVS